MDASDNSASGLALSPGDLDLVARTIATEAATPDGRAAVASVIRNRLNRPDYPGTVAGVILQRGQFEPVSSPRWRGMSQNSPDYLQAADIAQRVFNGQLDDPTGGATYFWSPTTQTALGRPAPAWSIGRAPTAIIGGNAFYSALGASASPASQPGLDTLKMFGIGPNASASAPTNAAPAVQPGLDTLKDFGIGTSPPTKAQVEPSNPWPYSIPPEHIPNGPIVPDAQPQPSMWDTLLSRAGQTASYIGQQAAGILPAMRQDWNAATALNEAGNARIQGGDAMGIPMALAGMAGQVSAPISALTQKFVQEPVTEATGNPDIGERAGIAANALAPSVGNALLRGIGNATVGTVDAETAQLAQLARQKYGIPVDASQISASPAVKLSTNVLGKLPFSGVGSDLATQQFAFNRAISNTFGENATKITPDVMNAARDRIGQMFENVANNTTVVADTKFSNDLLDVLTQAQREVADSEYKPLGAAFDNIVSKIGSNGAIDGDVYQAITRANTPLGRAIDSSNPNVSYWASQIRGVLDDALQRSAPPEMQAQLLDARRQWRNLMMVKPLAAKAPTGDISPALLQGAVNQNTGNALAFGGGGDLGQLARIGQRFLKPPGSSNTAENLVSVGGLAGAVHALSNSDLVGQGMWVGGGLLANRLLQSGIRSNALARLLISRSLNPSGPLAGAIPTAAPVLVGGGLVNGQPQQ